MLAPVVLLALLFGCATEAEKPDTIENSPAAAPALDLPPVAVKGIDVGPDLDAPSLTDAFGRAVSHTLGVPVIGEHTVTQAMHAGCPEPPCQNDLTRAYANANVVVTATVSRADDTYLAMGRALSGARVLGRVTASGKDPVRTVEELGWQLGVKLRDELAPGAASSGGGEK
jgi:hypothetical protein